MGDRGWMERGRRQDIRSLRAVFQEAPRGGPDTADPPSSPWCAWEPQGHSLQNLVHLEVCRSGPVLPAAQGIHGNRAAEWAGALTVQPEAEALLTEHVLRGTAIRTTGVASPSIRSMPALVL